MSPRDIGVLLVLLGAIFSGLRPLFGKLLNEDGLTAIMISLYIYLGSVLLFLPLGLREFPKYNSDQRRAVVFSILGGASVGIGGAAYFEALKYLSIATVTLIFFTYPAMVLGVKVILSRCWPSLQATIGVLSIFLGISLIVGQDFSQSNLSVQHVVIAFLAPVSWTILLFFLGGPLTVLGPRPRLGFITGGAVVTMLVGALIQQPSVWTPHSINGWLGMLCLILISGSASHLLTTIGVEKAGPERASFAGAVEVVTSVVVGWIVFLEPISLQQSMGIGLVLIALFLTRRL